MTNLCHHTLFAFLVTGAMLGSVMGLRPRHTGSEDSGLVNVLAAKGRFAVAYEGITTTSSPGNSAKYMTRWIRSSPMSADRKLQEEGRRYLVSVIAGVTGDGICPDLDPTFRMTCSGGQAALVDQEDTNCNLEEGSSIVCSGQGRVIVDCIFTCNLGGDDVVGQGIFVGSICPDFSVDYGDIMCTPSTSTRVSGSDPLCLTTCGGGICTEQDLIPLRANVYLPSCEWEASEGNPSPPPTRAPSPLPTKAPIYTISDGSGGTDLGTATIVVPGVDDPLFVSSWNKLLAADGADFHLFGESSAISGDTIVIGAKKGSRSGSVYVFARKGDAWVEVSKLVPSDGSYGDRFGDSVAISGDTIVIGANQDRDNGFQSGSAYVFVREGETWIEWTKLVPSDGARSAFFGSSVAISGDTIVIGATGDDENGIRSGSAYVFAREGEAWVELAKLLPSDGAPNYSFGLNVAMSSDSIVIGSTKDYVNGSNSGSAYIFAREGLTWVERAKLVPSDGADDGYFGSSVAVSDDTVVVGANGNGNNVIGSAYVFVREGMAWVEHTKLVPSDGAIEGFFGKSAAISGNTVVVGAYDDGGIGSAYVFTREEGEAWLEQGKLIPPDGEDYDYMKFGQSIAISDNTVVVGARYGTNDNGARSGSAYVVELTVNTPLTAESNGCKDITDQDLCVLNGDCHWKFGKEKCVDLCQGRSNEYQCVNAGGGGKCIWNSTDVCSPTYPPKSSEIASAAPTSFYSALHVVSIMLLITLS